MHNGCLIDAQFVCPLKILSFRNPLSKRLPRILTRAHAHVHTRIRDTRSGRLLGPGALGSPSPPASLAPGPLARDRCRPTTLLRGLGASWGRDTHFRSSMTLACSFSSLMSTRRFTVFLPLSSPGGPQDAPGLRYSAGSWKSKRVCQQHRRATRRVCTIPKTTRESQAACKNQRHLQHIQHGD